MKELELEPYYIFREDVFGQNIVDFKKELAHYFGRYILGYSFKTNSLPYVIALAKEYGCYAEVVSDTEYNLALEVGYSPEHIIFNGPIKSHDMFWKAIERGSIVNIDSKREVKWLEEISHSGIKAKVGVRVNFDVEKELAGHTQCGEEGGRFGFSHETGELGSVIAAIRELQGIEIAGLHMHISSKSKAKEVYSLLAAKACRIADQYGILLDYIDVGGGFFGGADGGKAYSEYVRVICDEMRKYFAAERDICLIVEPGASLVATAFDYVTQAIDVKEIYSGRMVVTNGSRLHIDPFMRKNSFLYDIEREDDQQEIKCPQVICGYTCMENDRFMKVDCPEIRIGDRITYHVVGAYTIGFNSLFIEPMPAVYIINEDGSLKCIRDKWSVKECLQRSVYEKYIDSQRGDQE